jgi:hypothetical protein
MARLVVACHHISHNVTGGSGMRTNGVRGLCLVTSLTMPASASPEERLCQRPIGTPTTPVAAVKPAVALRASGPA